MLLSHVLEVYVRRIVRACVFHILPDVHILPRTSKHEEKEQRCVKGIEADAACCKVVPYELLIDELFDPQDETNQRTNDCMSGVIPRLINALTKELRDPKKITSSHLSSQDGELSWINSTEEDLQNVIGVLIVNDPCEHSFGILADELKSYENLGLTFAGSMTLCKKNGDFASGFRINRQIW